jgi:hypothetical protein
VSEQAETYDDGVAEGRAECVGRLRRRADSLRSQECFTTAHRDRCDHAAAVLDQVADEIEGELET